VGNINTMQLIGAAGG